MPSPLLIAQRVQVADTTTCYDVSKWSGTSQQTVPIGKPVKHRVVAVLGEDQNPVGIEEPGEN